MEFLESEMEYTKEYLGQIISSMDFSASGKMFITLVKLPACLFPEYVPDGERIHFKGDVIRQENEKYLMQNQGRLDPNIPLSQQPILKLFRDSGPYPWVREEFCLRGFERYYDDGDPGRTGWYRVISANVDSATPPPNSADWEKLDS